MPNVPVFHTYVQPPPGAPWRNTRLTPSHGAVQDTLMLSESGAYAMLLYHYHPENRHLRQWLTHEVVPAMRCG